MLKKLREKKKENPLLNKRQNVLAHIAVNIVSGSTDRTGIGFSLGGAFSYYFVPKVGVFVGTDYVKRNIKDESAYRYRSSDSSGIYSDTPDTNEDISLTYLDIPFGFTFRYITPFMKDIINAFYLGLFYAIGLDGDVKYTNQEGLMIPSPKEIKEKNYLGLLFASENYFPVYGHFKMGFFVRFKFGFSESVTVYKNNGINISEMFIGLGFKY